MRIKTLPPADILRQLLEYDPETGALRWKPRGVEWFEESPRRGGAANVCAVWNARYANKDAFTRVTDKGYRVGKLLGASYSAHRVIWKLVTGIEPEEIDHINRDKGDNRLANLRSVDHSANMRNKEIYPTNTSGHRHIHWMPKLRRWTVQLTVPGKGQRQLAWCETIEEAVNVRDRLYEELGYDK